MSHLHLRAGASVARRVFFPTKQSQIEFEIASGKEQERPRNDGKETT
ncbi:MAG: hypothetical protein RIR73_2226 [Chloroflexota bacterium]